MNYYYVSHKVPPSEAQVAADPLIKQSGLCPTNYAVRLHKQGPGKWFGHAFPRVPMTSSGLQTTTLLVRGSGIFMLTKAKETHFKFKSSRYTRLRLKAHNWSGAVVRIYLRPHETAWLVPLDSYPGEYTLSIANTSVGKRFEMWRAAWDIFLKHPFLGAGTGAYREETHELIRQGRMAPFISVFDHPHNDYLDALSSRGVVGFIVLLALLLVPLRRFLRAFRSPVLATHAIGLAGVLTVAGFAIYGLTDTIFLHSIMISWYVIYMALFYALLETREGSSVAHGESPKPV